VYAGRGAGLEVPHRQGDDAHTADQQDGKGRVPTEIVRHGHTDGQEDRHHVGIVVLHAIVRSAEVADQHYDKEDSRQERVDYPRVRRTKAEAESLGQR